ncbi:MAG: GNAT family N-acetyltransferase [Myxococcota bacterium]
MQTRVTLRPYELSDASELYAAVQESVSEVSRWLPWCHSDYSLTDAVSWIRATRDGHARGTMYDFAIVDSSGRYVGACGINAINAIDRFANLGYWVRSSRTGEGIAPNAVRELVSWTFSHTALNRLEIVVAVGNTRSQRVAEKVGAQQDGVLRQRVFLQGRSCDAMMFSLVRSR